MDFRGKNVDKGGPGSPQARVDKQTSDLVTLRKDFTQHLQVLSDKESSGKSGSAKSGEARDLIALLKDFTQHFRVLPDKESSGKSGCSKSGEASAFDALFQAPLGTKIHDKRQEVDEDYHRMRGILHNPKYMDGDRLSPGDEIAVRNVLKYHPKCEQKTGSGIAYIKIQKIYDDVTRCFWVVRVDGTEIDFSFHKCLKGKAAKECPGYRHDSKFYVPQRASQRYGAYTRF